MSEFNGLEIILNRFLGQSKNGFDSGTQLQFNCPACQEELGLSEGDDKYNLEVNLLKGKFRCWRCEHENDMHGKVSSLIKRFGNSSILNEYRDEINNIKKSKEYEFNFIENNEVFDDDEEFVLALPEKTYEFKFDGNKKEEQALLYLTERGVNEYLIKKHKLCFTNNECPNKSFRNRIIIPSYDKYGYLNYFTGRDYSGKSFRKYYNAENTSKKEIVFNENLLNPDADIILVEGPTDHFVVPNSITLLGKTINSQFYIYEYLIKHSTQNIIVFLDNDATIDSFEICKRLANINTCGRLRVIPTQKLMNDINQKYNFNLDKLDPSKLYEKLGYRGISYALKQSEEYECV